MEFRRLIASDTDSYFENRLRALEHAPSAFLTTLEEEKARGNEHFAKTLAHTGNERAIFGALQSGKVIGTVGIVQESRPKLRHKAVIWGMYVDLGHRKCGVGAKILDLAIQFAKEEMQVALLYLSVEAENDGARRLYESRGFKVWGTEPRAMFFDNKFWDEQHMILNLRG
ncbi:MAG: N-acetyltransferase family protein [Bdellovibrionota bacterium]